MVRCLTIHQESISLQQFIHLQILAGITPVTVEVSCEHSESHVATP